jgi:hypothetical protein
MPSVVHLGRIKTIVTQALVLMLLSVASGSLQGAKLKPPLFSNAIGTQTIGVRYQFTADSALVETAKGIQALGSDTLKIAITRKYNDDYLIKKDPSIKSMLQLIQKKPEYKQVMDMPFRNIMLWVYPFSDKLSGFFKGHIPAEEEQAIYQEIYDFTEHLLKTYSGSGKSFFLGNWEGDWHMLKEVYDYELDPSPETIRGAIQWFNLRQRAIADAIAKTDHHDVAVYYYIELNHVRKSMLRDRPTIVNKVLPHIKTDFVSWSSYDITTTAAKKGGQEGKKMVVDALNYIEKHLPPSDIKGKRIILGEYGFHLGQVDHPTEQERCAALIMQWSLEWGCPFILYWELYCNEIEPSNNEHRGFWLVDKNGDKQPAWYLHRDMLKKANLFIENYRKKHGKLPPQQQYNRKVASWLKALPK